MLTVVVLHTCDTLKHTVAEIENPLIIQTRRQNDLTFKHSLHFSIKNKKLDASCNISEDI